MKKRLLILSGLLVIVFSISVSAGGKIVKNYRDIRGNILTVVESNISETPDETSVIMEASKDDLQLGDVVTVNGVKERIIAISEDGGFITEEVK